MLQTIKKNKTPSDEISFQQRLITGITGLLLATIGVAVAISSPSSARAAADLGLSEDGPPPARLASAPEESLPAVAAAARARGRTKCTECGVIGMTRHIGPLGEPRRGGITPVAAAGAKSGGREELAAGSKTYEVSVRMQDGSSRVFKETSSTNWREGERVILIDGLIAAND